MFRGTIPASVQKIMHEVVSAWSCPDIYVGCSGNFTVERVISPLGFGLHSNDVTLHSASLGYYFSKTPITLAVKQEHLEQWGWLEEYMGDDAEKVATVLLVGRMASGMTPQGKIKDNPYYKRIMKGYRKQWDDMHAATVQRLVDCKLQLKSYHSGDVIQWLEDQVPAEAGFISYPPFFGAAQAFERDFARLEMLFDWDKPSYPPLDEGRLKLFFALATGRDHWCVGTNREIEELEEHLVGMSQTTNRGVPIFLYSSSKAVRVVTPAQKLAEVPVDRLAPGMVIGGKMTLAILDYAQFQTLRSEYMNPFIRPGSASLAVGVLVDGLLIGVFAYSTAPSPGAMADPSRIYMLSDFPVAPSDYPRLSKLVLYAALSRESQLLAERAARRRIRYVYTTAFSNRPASMKYRGLFNLHNRKENPTAKAAWGQNIDTENDPYYSQKYELNYIAPIGEWDLAEGLALWKKKHGKREPNADASDQD